MKSILNNFITSGFKFDDSQMYLKGRYQMLNTGIFLGTIGILFGMIGNLIRDVEGFVAVEFAILIINFSLAFILRKYRNAFNLVVNIMTAQFTFLFLFLIYVAEPESMKHVWLFTYPIVLLYIQDTKKRLYWVAILVFMLIIAPLQNFIEVKYSLYQVTYLSFALMIVYTIIHFYQQKMDEAKDKVLEQQVLLRDFNFKLENQVLKKTAELRELNESLEGKVQDKIDELIHKDRLLTVQSKQAVMGEMISMIAHQWRQPLSTVTLQIADLQLKKLMGNEIVSGEVDDAFNNISDTIIYLSETIDDFKTYFHPDKEVVKVEIHALLQKIVNFTISRVKDRAIEIAIINSGDIYIKTYVNELIQVVLNILNNAIDAHNDTKVENPIINLSVKEVGSDVFIYIEDNAGGIDSENMPKLFEPYFSTKGKNGTGLGLYMSQMIIEKQFDGEIEVDSFNYSTIFTVKIPKEIS